MCNAARMAVDIERWGSGGPWESIVGYSRVARTGDYVHVAGTTATVAGKVVGVGDAGEQTRVILRIIGESLAKAGATFDQVVRTRVFVSTSPTGKRSARPTARSSPTSARCRRWCRSPP